MFTQKGISFKVFCSLLTLSFLTGTIAPGYAQSSASPLGLISASSAHTPWALKGIKIYPDDPLKFDFLLEEGDVKLSEDELKKESELLIKYFLAALTLPEEDLWVNLSPFEQDKIIPEQTSQTEMGKGLLEQDYLLKKLVSSLTYPETDLGKSFWDKVYQKAYQRFGTSKIPVNTFNKVWIVPDKAVVYEDGQRALIDESRLKVMMEQDYLAFKNRGQGSGDRGQTQDARRNTQDAELNDLSSQVMKEVVIPAIEEEVNTGENFVTLRKMYRSFILASWFKKRLKESLLGQVYVDQKKTKGIDIDEPELKEKIYQQYLQSYKDGLYNYIKTDYSPQERKHIKRKYWSGGIGFYAGASGFADSPVVRTLRVSSPFADNFWKGQEVTAVLVGLGNEGDAGVVAASLISAGSPLKINLEDLATEGVIKEQAKEYFRYKYGYVPLTLEKDNVWRWFEDFLTGKISLEQAKNKIEGEELDPELLLYYLIPTRVVLENPAIVHPETAVPVSDTAIISLLGRYLKMEIKKKDVIVTKNVPPKGIDVLLEKVDYLALAVRKKDKISNKDIDELLKDKEVFPYEDYTEARLGQIKEFLQFHISPEKILSVHGLNRFSTKIHATSFRKAAMGTLRYGLPHSIISDLADYIRKKKLGSYTSESFLAVGNKMVSPKILTEGQVLIFLNDIIGNSGSPLAKGEGVGVPDDKEVDKIIESVLRKYNLSHLDRPDKGGINLTTTLDSLYDYIEMNYLEKLPWMSNKNWRKIYQKRNVWEDLEIGTARNKAINHLVEILSKNKYKNDEQSAQELAQKIVDEFIAEIIKLNIAAKLAQTHNLSDSSRDKIISYLSSLLKEKKEIKKEGAGVPTKTSRQITDEHQVNRGAKYALFDSIALEINTNNENISLEKAKEILQEANKWLDNALGLNASSALAMPGGIALDHALLDLKTQGASSSIRYNFDPAKLQAISANLAGFEPKIISIKKNGN